MRGWRWAWSLLLLTALAALVGCSGGGPGTSPAATPPSSAAGPRLGAPRPTPSTPPAAPMDYLERAVDEHLAARLDDEGLSLRYVDCPHWGGHTPSTLTCKGYVDGVLAQVAVTLSRGAHGTEFDAWLEEGVVSTARLVDRLERQGYTRVRCGSVPAYPARVGMRIVCRVDERGKDGYLVATVIDRHGAVRIQDY